MIILVKLQTLSNLVKRYIPAKAGISVTEKSRFLLAQE
jgi:hypothetical protein